jgi:hypothetical protein
MRRSSQLFFTRARNYTQSHPSRLYLRSHDFCTNFFLGSGKGPRKIWRRAKRRNQSLLVNPGRGGVIPTSKKKFLRTGISLAVLTWKERDFRPSSRERRLVKKGMIQIATESIAFLSSLRNGGRKNDFYSTGTCLCVS